jgi:CRISPR-associated protein Csx3
MIKFTTTKQFATFTLIEFELEGPIDPSCLSKIKPPKVNPRLGVALSGRGPVWLHSCLAHEYHFCRWVGHYDPRLGIVVAQSHKADILQGDVIAYPDQVD